MKAQFREELNEFLDAHCYTSRIGVPTDILTNLVMSVIENYETAVEQGIHNAGQGQQKIRQKHTADMST